MYRIIAKQTCVEIHGYDLGDKPEIERLFTVYDDVTHKLIPKGFDYNEEERILYLPRGMNIGLIEKVCNAPIEMDRGYNNFNKAVYKLTTEPRDDNQVKSIAYLSISISGASAKISWRLSTISMPKILPLRLFISPKISPV